MPPFRQPTPSPPPPPVTPAASAATMSSSGSMEGRQLSMGSQAGNDFVIPPNFVPPPPPREVASGVSNLGNTCYMNAALQALAHAPELCHALDAESHLRRCPVALRNERRRRKRAREAQAKSEQGAAEGGGEAASSPLRDGKAEKDNGKSGGKKSHRRSNSSSSNGSNGSKGKKKGKQKKDENGTVDYDPEYEFCTLCEVERLMGRVHSRPEEMLDDPEEYDRMGKDNSSGSPSGNPRDTASTPPPVSAQEGPVIPETFVSGFMSKVAPWFRRGVQEDSHEFLRLLIDAMQNSCKGARNDKTAAASGNGSEDTEYPFRLFRGTVESNVKCSACRATSCKIDPIEDIGLDILPVKSNPPPQASNPYASSTRGAASMSSSRSTSPTSNMALADVQQALERFISSEHLDSGYKCEKCGKLGKATKTSRLASIPPILTLHLKRFRYGSGGGKRGGGGFDSGSSSTRSSRSARGGGGLQSDFDNVGPSGSAKIEGHVRFSAVLDVKPYLTPELQRGVFQKAICRLFAVVVHSGKNSHSGHYVAYVHNVSKKEWWKMDDARIVRVPWAEVQNAEAYMLFYRVTSHPVARQLKDVADAKEERARRVMDEIRRREEEAKNRAAAEEEDRKAAAAKAAAALQELVEKPGGGEDKVPGAAPTSDAEDPASPATPAPSLGKRARPALASGEEWARAATTLSPDYLPLFSRIQEFITDNVTFSPEFFGYITEEYNRMSSKLSIGGRVKNNKRIKTLLGKGPGGVYPPEDVRGGAEDLHGGILDLFHQIAIMYKKNNKGSGSESFLLPKILDEIATEGGVATEKKVAAATVEEPVAPSTPAEVVPALTIDNELIIPADNTESYDGAL